MPVVIYSFSGLYDKIHIQSVYNVTGRKLKPACHYEFFSVNNMIFVPSDNKHVWFEGENN